LHISLPIATPFSVGHFCIQTATVVFEDDFQKYRVDMNRMSIIFHMASTLRVCSRFMRKLARLADFVRWKALNAPF